MTYPTDPQAPRISQADRIRRGDFEPYAAGADGRDSSAALATVQVLEEELDTIPVQLSARRTAIRAQIVAWRDRAALLQELGR